MKAENGVHNLEGYTPWAIPLGNSSGYAADLAAANADDAYLYPFWNPATFVSSNIRIHFTSVAAGNYDIGIYDNSGNRVKSLGSTAVPGVAGTQTVAFALTLPPGLYWLALAISTVTPTMTVNGDDATFALFRPMRYGSSFPLPSSLNLASPTERMLTNRNYKIILENANGPAF